MNGINPQMLAMLYGQRGAQPLPAQQPAMNLGLPGVTPMQQSYQPHMSMSQMGQSFSPAQPMLPQQQQQPGWWDQNKGGIGRGLLAFGMNGLI